MIDFVNPRSKKTKLNILIGALTILVFGGGIFLTYSYVNEYFQAKALSKYSYLPSGDIVVGDLDTDELLSLYEENESTKESYQSESDNQYVEADKISASTGILSEDNTTSVIKNTQPAGENIADNEEGAEKESTTNKPVPAGNTLVVPQMGVNGLIYEGQTEATLSKGLWRMPSTSDDPTAGNMVITAHRYLRRPPNPNTFYLLDKLNVGDEFYMYWQGNRYDYKVREIKIVTPDEIDILYNTPKAQITLFSCTPLFTSEKRLVVIADLLP